jgi:hypothetical protein
MSIICFGPNGTGPFEQRIQVESDPRLGTETTRTHIGAFNQLYPLLLNYQSFGWSGRIGPYAGQLFILTARIGATWNGSGLNDNPVAQWEFTSNKIIKDLLTANLSVINTLNVGEVGAIREAILNTPNLVPVVGQPWSSAAGSPNVTTNGANIFYLMVAGETGVQIFAPTLRSTVTTSNIYFVSQSFNNTGRLLLNSSIIGLLPPTLAVSLSGIGGTWTNSNGLVFNYGWMVDAPNVISAAFTKTQVIQEYQWGLWPQIVYGTPT